MHRIKFGLWPQLKEIFPNKKSEQGFPANKGLKTGINTFIALILMQCKQGELQLYFSLKLH